MAITTIFLGSVMAAMTDAFKATESAQQITDLNNGLRTAMDLMVRDMLQVGQGLPGGHAILVPNGTNSAPMQLPGPIGTDYQMDGPSFCPPHPPDDADTVCEQIQAVIPGPNRGPVVVDGQPATDMITTIAADSAFESVGLTVFANNGLSMTVAKPCSTGPCNAVDEHPSGHLISEAATAPGADTSDNIHPGDLIMLTKGSSSALMQVSTVSGQVVNFAAGDSLNLNQTAAADGTAGELRNTAPADTPPVAPAKIVSTLATRIRMISYYLDVTTDPRRPRLIRRIGNNGVWNEFDNNNGTVVAFDIEGLQITYDLVDGVNNPSNVRMNDDDLDGSGACSPLPCYPSQIRKINIMLQGRSRLPRRGTQQFFRNRLITQVSLRSLAFVDRYR
jgi:hypothetical protein